MAVNNKPFNIDDRLARTTFKGKPTIFSAQDLNRYLEALKQATLLTSEVSGGKRENWEVSITSPVLTQVSPTQWDLDFTWEALNPSAGDGYAYYKGLRFKLPTSAPNAETVTLNPFIPSNTVEYPFVYFVLCAVREELDFSISGPVLHIPDAKEYCSVSGVSGSMVPFQLPGSDNTIYGSEFIVPTTTPTAISLSPNEEIIGIVATYKPQFEYEDGVSVYTPVNTTQKVLYNFPTSEETVSLLQTIRNAALYPFTQEYVRPFETNGSITEALLHFIDQYRYGQSFQDSKILEAFSDIIAIEGLQQSMADDIQTLQDDVSNLQGSVTLLNPVLTAWTDVPYASLPGITIYYSIDTGGGVYTTTALSLNPTSINLWSLRYKKIGKTVHIQFTAEIDFVAQRPTINHYFSGFDFSLSTGLSNLIAPRAVIAGWQGDLYKISGPSFASSNSMSWVLADVGGGFSLHGKISDQDSRYRLLSGTNDVAKRPTAGELVSLGDNYVAFCTTYESLL